MAWRDSMLNELITELVSYAYNRKLIKDSELGNVESYLNKLFPNSIQLNKLSLKTRSLQTILSDLEDIVLKDVERTPGMVAYFENSLMATFAKSHDDLINKFYIDMQKGPQIALDQFYQYNCDVNYIKLNDIAKYSRFTYKDEDARVEMVISDHYTDFGINLNKPTYSGPRCEFCKENEGFYDGKVNNQLLRFVPVKLKEEDWNLKFDPYGCFDQKCYVSSPDHDVQHNNDLTITRLLDFVDSFPTYIIGSQADLPLVSNSMLDHEHYEGGFHTFPIETAKAFYTAKLNSCKVSALDWPISTVKLESANRDDIEEAYNKFLRAWKRYENKSIGVDNSSNNAISVAVRLIGGKYVCYIMLRNNKTTEHYPNGIFNMHPEFYNIRKGNIGLIESMGFFELPSRLKEELAILEDIIKDPNCNKDPGVHKEWLDELKTEFKNDGNLNDFIINSLGNKCKKSLECCKLFVGKSTFQKFIDKVINNEF